MGRRLLGSGVLAGLAALAVASVVLAQSGLATQTAYVDGLTVRYAPAGHGLYHVLVSGARGPYGTPNPDALVGTAGPDWIHGGDGGDAIYGLAGNDVLFGDAGDDQVWGGPGNDVMYGGSGTDTMLGRWGDDKIYTRDDTKDFVQCGAGYDVVYADAEDVIDVTCDKVVLPA
jgi:Ca2+-binding RTX toxin-like protein